MTDDLDPHPFDWFQAGDDFGEVALEISQLRVDLRVTDAHHKSPRAGATMS